MDDRKILVTAVCKSKRGASLLVEKDIVLQDPFLTIKVKDVSLERRVEKQQLESLLHLLLMGRRVGREITPEGDLILLLQ